MNRSLDRCTRTESERFWRGQSPVARSVTGGEGEVGEKDHGSLANLGVVGVGPEVVGGGNSMAEQR